LVTSEISNLATRAWVTGWGKVASGRVRAGAIYFCQVRLG